MAEQSRRKLHFYTLTLFSTDHGDGASPVVAVFSRDLWISIRWIISPSSLHSVQILYSRSRAMLREEWIDIFQMSKISFYSLKTLTYPFQWRTPFLFASTSSVLKYQQLRKQSPLIPRIRISGRPFAPRESLGTQQCFQGVVDHRMKYAMLMSSLVSL